MKPILQSTEATEDAVLREESMPVLPELFGTEGLRSMIIDMEATLDNCPDGVALAAPQIGLLWRIFIVRYDRMLPPPEEGESERSPEVGIFINPAITRTSKRRKTVDEGCLSVKSIYGKTQRFERASVRAQDEHGNWFERGGGGILAQAFQHEIDHLNGMLFTDHATDMITIVKEHHHDV